MFLKSSTSFACPLPQGAKISASPKCLSRYWLDLYLTSVTPVSGLWIHTKHNNVYVLQNKRAAESLRMKCKMQYYIDSFFDKKVCRIWWGLSSFGSHTFGTWLVLYEWKAYTMFPIVKDAGLLALYITSHWTWSWPCLCVGSFKECLPTRIIPNFNFQVYLLRIYFASAANLKLSIQLVWISWHCVLGVSGIGQRIVIIAYPSPSWDNVLAKAMTPRIFYYTLHFSLSPASALYGGYHPPWTYRET
jgi:hypothetical protein